MGAHQDVDLGIHASEVVSTAEDLTAVRMRALATHPGMTMPLRTLDDLGFETDVLASELPVLIDVTARWCGPCRAQLPIVERLAAQLAGRLRVVTLDLEHAPVTATRLGIRGAPTLIVFAGGREIARHVGLTPETILRRMVEPTLAA
jgi:thioredoxin 1